MDACDKHLIHTICNVEHGRVPLEEWQAGKRPQGGEGGTTPREGRGGRRGREEGEGGGGRGRLGGGDEGATATDTGAVHVICAAKRIVRQTAEET